MLNSSSPFSHPRKPTRLGNPSFLFCSLRKTFFATCLSGCAHELVATLAFLSDQGFTLRSDDFFHWPQIGKERLVSGHGKPETNPAAEWIATCERGWGVVNLFAF
jgi:hypothetical protein